MFWIIIFLLDFFKFSGSFQTWFGLLELHKLVICSMVLVPGFDIVNLLTFLLFLDFKIILLNEQLQLNVYVPIFSIFAKKEWIQFCFQHWIWNLHQHIYNGNGDGVFLATKSGVSKKVGLFKEQVRHHTLFQTIIVKIRW